VHIEVGGDVAFARFLMHCGATLPDGTTHSGWMRATACYRRVNDEWKIVHDHCSVPFDPESCKALVELQP
jgi:ketosteroid isomerase-like protein